ncbi:hypothetical protein TON_0124 [Thermococcus onnurineus NA1]|uniref:Uncharacterized protein n=1 Tax=Thermococcus onnurineus (strain NA1) TaxID=523850 RepID=B6YSS2_THEON|nr:hypothetical protein TON_0124 [Thermococcus onnurineus NA1]
MIWMTALYEYMLEREMKRKRKPIPEELEYVERLME